MVFKVSSGNLEDGIHFNRLARKYKHLSVKANGFMDPKLVYVIRKKVVSILRETDPALIYDCGCGDGSVTYPLCRSNRIVFGIDSSKEMCSLANEKGLLASQINLRDLLESPLESFFKKANKCQEKCILFCESLCCLDHPLSFLTDLLATNKDSKFLVMSFANPHNPLRIAFTLIDRFSLCYFSLEELCAQCLTPQNFRLKATYAVLGVPFIAIFCIPFHYKNLIALFFVNLLALNYIVLAEPIGRPD